MNPLSVDRIYRFYSEDLSLRAAVVLSTHTVQEICERHQAFPIARIALGRLISGTALLAAHTSEGQQVGVHVQGDGPIGSLYAEASFEGQVRAHCSHPQFAVGDGKDFKESGNLLVGPAVGVGTFTVTRSVPFEKQPFVATVPIVSGEIGKDLAYYLHQSYQIPSIVSVGVFLDADGKVAAAGGVLIELMPGASEFTVRMLERQTEKAQSLSKHMLKTQSPQDLLRDYVGEMTLRPIGEGRELKFVCRCTQDRVERALHLLGKIELGEMIAKGEPVEAKCEFCSRVYSVSVDVLKTL